MAMDGGIGSRDGITEFHGKSGDGTANGDGVFTEPKRITAGAGGRNIATYECVVVMLI